MALVISLGILHKINEKHSVTKEEVEQCFMNVEAFSMNRCDPYLDPYLEDRREEHATETGAPTLWFIGETDTGRRLKIVFVLERPDIRLRTAFPPTESQAKNYFDKLSMNSLRSRFIGRGRGRVLIERRRHRIHTALKGALSN